MADTDPDETHAFHGIGAMIARLRTNARAFVRAEVRYILAEFGVRASSAVPALIMALIALALVCSALTALLMGLIFALAPYVTIWGAVALITLSAILVAFILLQQSVRLIKIARRPGDEM